MGHLCAQPAGDFITHARIAILHVIPTRLPRAPELVQIAGQATCSAHQYVRGIGGLVHHSDGLSLRDGGTFADAVDAVDLLFPISAKAGNPPAIVFSYVEPRDRLLQLVQCRSSVPGKRKTCVPEGITFRNIDVDEANRRILKSGFRSSGEIAVARSNSENQIRFPG